ncbi:MAG: YeeE/YedE family protein [Alphaproteobacteria bacterium]|nr:YeeE/YedE family protein [Alphaproteobacteria bacterium]
MENFTPVSALIGGALIGLAAAGFVLLNGRIAGVSGVLAGLLPPTRGDSAWRLMFLIGLLVGALIYRVAVDFSDTVSFTGNGWLLVGGGLLVGFGTRLGGGCTSGHGVCGISRLSPRSLVATAIFMAGGIATVYVARHWVGA